MLIDSSLNDLIRVNLAAQTRQKPSIEDELAMVSSASEKQDILGWNVERRYDDVRGATQDALKVPDSLVEGDGLVPGESGAMVLAFQRR